MSHTARPAHRGHELSGSSVAHPNSAFRQVLILMAAPQNVQIARVCKASAHLQESLAPGEVSRWGEAVGNIEDARVALDTLARAIEDAVFLDEDAYNQVAPVMQYQRTMQVLHPCLLPFGTFMPQHHHNAESFHDDHIPLSCCRCSNSG